MSGDSIDEILPLAREGWRMFPVRGRGKSPLISAWPTEATSEEAQLRAWSATYPDCNWAVATGVGSGVFCLDLDGPAGLEWYGNISNGSAQTRQVKTHRGRHLYYQWPENGTELRNSAGKIAPGVDLRGEGGYAVLPGSRHPEGSTYEWLSPATCPVQAASSALIEQAIAASKKIETIPGRTNDDPSDSIPAGERNSTLTSLAGSMRRRGMTEEAIAAALLAENQRRCDPPLSDDEVRQIAASVASYPSEPTPFATVQLLRTEDGKPRACAANVVALLRDSPEWAGVIGYDEFSERVVLRQPAPGFPPDTRPYPREWSDAMDVYAQCWLQRAGLLINSANVTASAVQAVAREKQNCFHPVRDYLESLVWDGIERADHWLEMCFGAEQSNYTSAVSRCWLISAIARVFAPACQVDCSMLLIGRQGVGKSSGLRALVPRDEWFADSVSTLASRDSRLELRGKWIIELSELSSLRRAEIEAVKSFLSERVDHFREPYGRHAHDFPRQCVFSASTNDETPLLDSTGNRRFWPVKVNQVNVEMMKQNREQLWAEAYVYFKRGEPWHLDSTELQHAAEAEQKRAYAPGPWDERISEWIENPKRRIGMEWEATPWAGSEKGRINIGDVLGHCIGLEVSKWEQGGGAAAKSVGRTLRHLGYHVVQAGSGPHRGKRFYLKGEETE
jgi:predicted P-loop ATPase